MYDQQPAFAVQVKLPLCDDNDPEGLCQVLVIRWVLRIFRLRDEYMGQMVAALHSDQTLKIMHLVPFYTKSLHQTQNQAVIILPDLIAAVLFRFKVARYTDLVCVVQHDTRLFVRDTLGNYNMGGQPLMLFAVKMNKAAHCA